MRNRPYPLYNTLPQITDLKDMVQTRTAATPDAEAFAYAEGKTRISKTCADFSHEIDALGTWLAGEGLQKSHVAILGDNCYHWIVAYLAVMNGGGIAVPVDRDLPAEKTCQLLRQADCEAVFASRAAIRKLDGVPGMEGIRVMELAKIPEYIELGAQALAAGQTAYTDHQPQPDDTAAIFFTSGTTGNHKGVMLSHGNIAADINAAVKNFLLEGPSLAVLPFHHSFGLNTAVLMPYHYGYPLYINTSMRRIQSDMQAEHPQTMFFVPLYIETFYKRIMANARKQGKEKLLARAGKISDFLLKFGIDLRAKLFADVQAAFGGNMQYVICGGAVLDPKYVKIFRTWGVELLNGYGITECSPVLSVNRNHYHRDGSIGTLLDGIEGRVADDGELQVRGASIMQGYYNQPEETAACLQDGWYSTGDLCRIDRDGFVFITGRKKNLIILSNGENVSPEEIEQQLQKDEAAAEVVVFGMNGILAAEFFPDEEHMGDQAYFEALVEGWNKDQPQYRRIEKVYLRDTEFEKNSTKKILRFKVTEAHHA